MLGLVQFEFMERCAAIDGAALGEGAFSPGPAIWVGKREIAHFDDEQSLDVRMTKAVIRERRQEFKDDPRVSLRRGGSDWIEVRTQSESDLDFALTLVSEAIAANLPTAAPGPPPSGSDLARRRRFH